MMGAALAAGILAAGCARAAAAGVYKELVMSTDRTTALVAPSAGQVSENFLVYLVNAGQQNEYMEQGVSDSSASTTYTIPVVPNSVGPGQTAYVTVTVRGAGGGFPYWIDYWAQIAGAPDTRKTARLMIDTLGTAVRPVSHHGSRPDALRLTVLGDRPVALSAAPGAQLAVFQPNGRQVWSSAAAVSAFRLAGLDARSVVVRIRSEGGPGSAVVLPW